MSVDTMVHRLLFLGMAVLISACAAGTPDAPDPGSAVLANFDGGTITVADLDQFLLTSPKKERSPRTDESASAWVRRQTARLFERTVLTSPEQLEGLEGEDAFQRTWSKKRRELLARSYLRNLGTDTKISPKEAHQYCSKHIRQYDSPEKRYVYNLLIEFPGDATANQKDALCDRVEQLRKKIVAGVSFKEMARIHSDSKTAIMGGFVGLVSRDQLRPDVAGMVFSIQPGQISRVLRNEAGCQIFMVQHIVPPTRADLNSTCSEILKPYIEERNERLYREALIEEAKNVGVEVPAWLTDERALNLKEVDTIFTYKNNSITRADLMAALATGVPLRKALIQLVGEILFSEAMIRDDPEKAEQLREAERKAFAYDYLRNKKIAEQLRGLPDRVLKQYYNVHQTRFTSDPLVETVIFSWPVGQGDPLASIKRPREFVAQIARSAKEVEKAWENFREDPGVRRENIPKTGLRALYQHRPDIRVELLQDLKQDLIIGPSHVADRFYVVWIKSYTPGRQLSFEEAGEMLFMEYRRTEGPDLERDLLSELQKKFHYRGMDRNLERYGTLLLEHLFTRELPPEDS